MVQLEGVLEISGHKKAPAHDCVGVMIKRKQYTTDLREAEWLILRNWFEKVETKQKRGRKRSHELRELINAVRYVLRNGCTWRDLPGDFPAWQSVYYHYRNWRKEGLWQKLNKYLRRKLRSYVSL